MPFCKRACMRKFFSPFPEGITKVSFCYFYGLVSFLTLNEPSDMKNGFLFLRLAPNLMANRYWVCWIQILVFAEKYPVICLSKQTWGCLRERIKDSPTCDLHISVFGVIWVLRAESVLIGKCAAGSVFQRGLTASYSHFICLFAPMKTKSEETLGAEIRWNGWRCWLFWGKSVVKVQDAVIVATPSSSCGFIFALINWHQEQSALD